MEDPDGALGRALPLDRERHLWLAGQVLAWSAASTPSLEVVDLAGLELTGHALVIREELEARISQLPASSELGELLGYSLAEAGRRLSVTSSALGVLAYAQGRARLVKGLYGSLDRLEQRPGTFLPAHT
ncbi:restriction endonuclease [Streptomyces sp. NPDC051563]|uniref:restriction endonuclease n=1 Tax=Streptomyces sp. NPDC051563 TaxID=3365659 RepID=UPI00378AA301